MSRKISLPVDFLLPEILASLQHNPNLVIEAPPGAGKTTRVPPALLAGGTGEILVLEPRRIAARLAARRVAWELGEEVGGSVGYQVRFEEVAGPQTRLRFVTEGVLTRKLIGDPRLKGVDTVVLDEFHERHLDSDVALALLKRLQRTRGNLRIVVMSATLNAEPVAQYLGNCPVLRSEGRLFDLAIRHLPYSPDPLPLQVKGALELLLSEGQQGHILAFLPGAAEIRRTMRDCDAVARRANLLVLPLHGDLPPKDQDRIVSETGEQKLILATNIAESSITVEGVTAVIDGGLARFATYSPWTGLPTLHVGRVSKASAKQRAGRAGRTQPGRVIRLYSEEDYLRRPEHDSPEIVRSDLSQLCLGLRMMKIDPAGDVDWLDAPLPAALENAETLLDSLGATGTMAERMARYPLPPRLSRMLVEAVDRGVGDDGCIAAALLGSGARSEKIDLLAGMDAERDYRAAQHLEQLRRIARPSNPVRHDDDALLISVLAGFPDRVARRKAGARVLLSNGVSAEVAGDPLPYEFLVALDAEDRKDKPLPLVRMTARVEPEWLIDLFPERIRESSEVVWNRVAERIEAVSALRYDQLVIQESRGGAPDVDAAAALLWQKAREAGIERFIDESALQVFQARMEFAGLQPVETEEAFRHLCTGPLSFAELKNAAKDFIAILEQAVDAKGLRELAPENVRLQKGRVARIHYELGKPPWIASRLQDFLGMKETPRIGRNRTPLVVHLLAPNQRAVQTTTDLAGFWERLYPQVRRELMRRYPRHAWPERP